VLLIAVLVPITVTVDVGHTSALGPLFKNLALFGGLIHFAARGPGSFSVERVDRIGW
jgi:putative oxidoreductase